MPGYDRQHFKHHKIFIIDHIVLHQSQEHNMEHHSVLFSPNFLSVWDTWSLLGFISQTGWMRLIWYLQALRVYNSMTLFLDSERPLFPTMNSIIFSLTLNRDDLPGWQLNLALENAGWWQVQIQYCKPPVYEWVPFWEHICKSNLFISPTKLA